MSDILNNYPLTGALLLLFFQGQFTLGQAQNVFYVGHSVCGYRMPNRVDDLAFDQGIDNQFDHQLIRGSLPFQELAIP